MLLLLLFLFLDEKACVLKSTSIIADVAAYDSDDGLAELLFVVQLVSRVLICSYVADEDQAA
jgi:hypothetical protein